MKYLVGKDTHQINVDAWFDEEERHWLGRGVVCWNPRDYCAEGEEEQNGYVVEDIDDEQIDPFLLNGEENLYYIDGKVLPRNKVQISYLLYITHPDFPDTRKIWLPLTDRQIGDFQEFIVQEFHKFTTECPDEVDNESMWQDWLDDAFVDADFYVDIPNAIDPVQAHVEYIDFDNPKVSAIEE